MTGRHLPWRVVRFDNIFNPPSQILAEYFLTIYKGESTRFARAEWSRQQESWPVLFEIEINAQILPVWRVVICYDESFDSTTSSTSLHRYLRNIFLSVLQVDTRYDRSSFVVTSRSIRVESCRFDSIYNPHSQTLAVYFLSVLQIDIRYDGSSFVGTSRSIRVNSTTSSTPYRMTLAE